MEEALCWHIGKLLTEAAFLEPDQHGSQAFVGTHHDCDQQSGLTQAAKARCNDAAQFTMSEQQQPALHGLQPEARKGMRYDSLMTVEQSVSQLTQWVFSSDL